MPVNPTAYPLDAPTITGTTITVDELLQQPERITRDVADLTMQRFYMGEVFTGGGGVSGGSLLYEQPNPLATDLYSDRDIKEVAPGEEFPILTFSRGVPMIAKPRKIGGKWWVSKEARKRNDVIVLARNIKMTANTLRRRIENLGLAELSAVITASSRFRTGTSWNTYAGLAAVNRTGTTGPVADIIAALNAADLEERGHVYDSLIMNPNQAASVLQAFPGQTLQQVFSLGQSPEFASGINNIYVTPRYVSGTALLFEAGAVGVWRNEFPLDEEAWYEEKTQKNWYQWSISPLFAVVDPYAMMELRGIA